MSVLKSASLGVRFLLELYMLAALGYLGFQIGPGPASSIVLAIGLPLIAAVVWGAFVSPKAKVQVSGPVRLATELALFGLAVGGLLGIGQVGAGLALGAGYGVNRLLMFAWGQ